MSGRIGMSIFDNEYTVVRQLEYDQAKTQNNGYQTKPRIPRQVTHTKTHPFLTLPDGIQSRTMPPFYTKEYTFSSYLVEPDAHSYLIQIRRPDPVFKQKDAEKETGPIFVSNIRKNDFDNTLHIQSSYNQYYINSDQDQNRLEHEVLSGNIEPQVQGIHTQKRTFDDLFRSNLPVSSLGSIIDAHEKKSISCNDTSCTACNT